MIETEPDQVFSLTFDPFDSANDRVVLEWPLLPVENNGGAAVEGYEIKY